jgi:capsule polysaccharide export protein KpsE/RkpR
MGGLSSLAAMAGFNLNTSSGSSELSPMLYPQIISSVPFQLEVMNTPFVFPNQPDPISIYTYFTEIKKPGVLELAKKYTLGLPFVILKAIKGDAPKGTNDSMANDLLSLTEDQEKIRKFLDEAISLDVNQKEGYLTLSVRAEDARIAAQVAQKTLVLLQTYITNYKVEKATSQLKFIEERYNDNKQEFEKTQVALANFRDKNKNVTSARAQTQVERLQSEYQLAFDVYSELAQQMEQARIQVKEDTPVFSVIKPVIIPFEKSSPNRPMILIIWTFLGGIIALGWIFGKELLKAIKEKWNKE